MTTLSSKSFIGESAVDPQCTIEVADPAVWDQLVSSFPNYTVFHTLGWLNAIACAYGLNVNLLQAEEAGLCIAVWPILTMRKAFLKIIGSPLPGWSTCYLGPLVAAHAKAQSVLGAFLKHHALKHYAYFACKVQDERRPIDLVPFGFKPLLKFSTYRIDLTQSETEIWNNCRRECRNHIRKAQKNGVEIRTETQADVVDDYWNMTVETFAKSGVKPTHNRQLIAEIWHRLVPRGTARFLSAWHQGQRVGTNVLLSDRQTMYYWGGASRLAFRHLSASNLLQWEAIRLAKNSSLCTYDFISTTGGPGVFKQSFGPQEVHVATHWERASLRVLGALKNRYESRLRQRQKLLS